MAGIKNCQIETPAARATIISLAFAKRQNANIAPNKTVNGRIVSVVYTVSVVPEKAGIQFSVSPPWSPAVAELTLEGYAT